MLYLDSHIPDKGPGAGVSRLNLPKTVISKLGSAFKGWCLWLPNPLSHCVSPDRSRFFSAGDPLSYASFLFHAPPRVRAEPSGPAKLLGLLL